MTVPFAETPLFEIDPADIVEPAPDPRAGLSAQQRRTLTRLDQLHAGYHPITRLRLHAEAAPVEDRTAVGRRCGNCVHRALNFHGYPKCKLPDDRGRTPYATHGAATDLPAWMPGCEKHTTEGEAEP